MGIVENWPSRWFFSANAEKSDKVKSPLGKKNFYVKFLMEDEMIRKVIREKLSLAGISAIEIERTASTLKVFIKAARPGFIIGRGGKGIEELTKAVESGLKKLNSSARLSVNIEELKRSEISAPYVAQQIAWDLEKRLPYRRTMKKYLEQIVQNREVKGAKILLSGRLDGNEIARREMLKHGSLPLQTLRSKIDYGMVTAFTSYGTVGIKVWIYKGETIINQKSLSSTETGAPDGGRNSAYAGRNSK